MLEVLVALGIFAVVALGMGSFLLDAFSSERTAAQRVQALGLVDEGLEAARAIRNYDWRLLTNGSHGIADTTGVWGFSGSENTFSQFFDEFTRTVIVEAVQRNGAGDIVSSGGTEDRHTKRVRARVTWGTKSVESATYLTNWGAPRIGNWVVPSLEASFDLTAANSGSGPADTHSLATEGTYLYVGRDSSAGKEFSIFDITNPASPQLRGQLDLGGRPNAIIISGTYAFLASTYTNGELQVVSIADPANPSLVTQFDLTVGNSGGGTGDATALARYGNYLFMTRDSTTNKFLVFDIRNPVSPQLVALSNALTGSPLGVVTDGQYAYVASTKNNAELQIFNIQNPLSPVLLTTFNLNSGVDSTDAASIAYAGTHLLLGRTKSAAPELYLVNITNPASPSLVGAVHLNGAVHAMAYDVGSGYTFLGTRDSTNDAKVINTVDLSLPPTVVAELNLANAPEAIVYSPVFDRVFIASSANTQELQVIKPQ